MKDPGAGLPREQAREARKDKFGWRMPKTEAERKRFTALLVLNGLDDEIAEAEKKGNKALVERLQKTKQRALKDAGEVGR